MKSNQAFGIFRCRCGELREIKCAAMIILFNRVGYALEGSRRMIELARNLDFQFRMSCDRVIINRDPAIRGNKLPLFR